LAANAEVAVCRGQRKIEGSEKPKKQEQKMKKTRFYMLTALTVACLGFASTAQASLVFQMDFNDADGNQSLTDRASPSFLCLHDSVVKKSAKYTLFQ
jgi:hypothetical protein